MGATASTVAVIGSGAVGAYYGARLAESGHGVKFFMRDEHYRHCAAHGINVTSVDGDIYIPSTELQVYNDVKSIGQVDWVILAIKSSSSLDSVPALIESLLTEDTRILAIMNGLIDDDIVELLKPLPYAAVYGGMAFICSNRLSPGRIDHSFYGSLNGGLASPILYGNTVAYEEHMGVLEALWAGTKVEFTSVPCLTHGRWQKNCWNLPFSGLSVAMGGISVDKIVSDPGLRQLADRIMDETIMIANADISSRGYSDSSLIIGDAEKKKMWYLSDNMGEYKPSTMLDLLARKPMEVKYLFRKPLERAKALNVDAPMLETIVTQIEAMQRMHNLF